MKTRITLTVDPVVSHRAKDVARSEGISLSSLVEKMLAEVSGTRLGKEPNVPFSERWRGRMRLKAATQQRAQRLAAKYKLGT